MISDDLKWCIKWLKMNGITGLDFEVESQCLDDFDISNYKIVKVTGPDFFDELATKLREMWPKGEKDGKYSWRGSQKEIVDRLKMLWAMRFKERSFTLEQCLVAARKYLANYEDNVKYMRTLKYFILKQPKVVDVKDGSLMWGQKQSVFADFLENPETFADYHEELESFYDEGRLV